MKKTKLLTVLVIGLFISNLVLAGFIMFRPKHPGIDAPRNRIIEKLNFDEKQIEAYDKLIRVHREDIANSEEEIMKLKNKLYTLLKDGDSMSEKDSLINGICKVQQKIENIHYDHFTDIKDLCKPGQLNAYAELTSEIAALFAHPRPKK